MEKTGADAFVYAKACGMVSRSFVGPRAERLFGAKRLPDLWSLLYEEPVPVVPEGLLALLLERKSEERVVNDFIALLSRYDSCDPVSRALLSLFDYNNLKVAVSALLAGSKEPPFMVDTGSFALFDTGKWPDLAAMTRNTPFSWYKRIPDTSEQVSLEIRLDRQYFHSLWSAVRSLGKKDRESIERQVREEIVLQNIIWVMRLRVYYTMGQDEILSLLTGTPGESAPVIELLHPAMAVLKRSIDSWNDWAGWKYSWLLNPHEEGVPWTLDPRWAQLAADKYLYKLALMQFHREPFTVGVLVSFFKIKQLEAQMIRVASEGLRLGASAEQMHEFTGDTKHA